MKETINAVSIQLKANEEALLFIMLYKDGTINRLGNGTIGKNAHDLFVGIDKDSIFEKFINLVNEDDLQHAGRYRLPEPKGDICILTILFQIPVDVNRRNQIGFEFIYGSESQGPPSPIRQMLMSAIRLTDSWYEKQKQMVKGNQ